MTDLITATEVAEMLRNLGCEAENSSQLNQEGSRVNANIYRIPWQIELLGSPPFHTELLVRVPMWVNGDPLRWTNNWNRERSSQAFAIYDEGTNRPLRKGRRHLVGIESYLSFGEGVEISYVVRFLGWWISELRQLSIRPGVEFFEELPL